MAARDNTRDPLIVHPVERHATWTSGAASCAAPLADRDRTIETVSICFPRSIFLIAERLVQIWSNNEREFIELDILRLKAARVHAYLVSPRCNRALAQACLDHLRVQRRERLARLRANRRA